ncbi:MAG: hypothetical protein U0R65_02640 [Candidatus Nanopelagicales bacterium]
MTSTKAAPRAAAPTTEAKPAKSAAAVKRSTSEPQDRGAEAETPKTEAPKATKPTSRPRLAPLLTRARCRWSPRDDPDLLTLRAAALLADADVIVADADVVDIARAHARAGEVVVAVDDAEAARPGRPQRAGHRRRACRRRRCG